jgi:NitT/TauT family transport system substrate-binding protein
MKWFSNLKMLMTAIIALVVIGLASIYTGCERKKTGNEEKVTIAVSTQPISAPVYIAYAKGYFDREGLKVALQPFWTGKDALASVLKGAAHFGTVAETPIMFAGLKGENFLIIATVADSNKYAKIVARKDRGIKVPEDLRGRKVGVSMGTNAEYFLDTFLTFYRIPQEQVRIVPMKPLDMAEALVKGDIDAAVTWNPHAAKQQKLLGANAITLENESIYKVYWNIVAAQDFVKAHPETVKKLLRGLIQAQHYIEHNPEDTQKIMAEYVGQDAATLGDFNFDVRLSQSLIISLEDQARWAVRKRLTDAKDMPNFLHLVYTGGMEVVAPDSVFIVHK